MGEYLDTITFLYKSGMFKQQLNQSSVLLPTSRPEMLQIREKYATENDVPHVDEVSCETIEVWRKSGVTQPRYDMMLTQYEQILSD